MKKIKHPISAASLLLCVIVLISVRLSHPPKNILSYDTFGYYIYLPARHIYHDPGIHNFEWVKEINQKYNNTPTFYQFSEGINGQKVIRFNRGISYLLAPGFYVGHAWAKLSGAPQDGFSKPYQQAIWIWGMIFNLLGFYLLKKILLRYFNDLTTGVTLIVLLLISNLYFFYGYGSDIPHVYLFTLNAALIWFTIHWHHHLKIWDAALIGLTLGMIAISRISEVLIVFIPLLWGVKNKETLKSKFSLFLNKWPHVLVAIIAGIIPLLSQIIYWKSVSGEYLYQTYNDPGSTLDLMNPRFFHTLLSFRKGWLIYAPVMILALWGIYKAFRKKEEWAWAILVYIALDIYVISSFTSLLSYGWRAFLQSYVALVLPMGVFIQWMLSKKPLTIVGWCMILVILGVINIFQAWQINMGIIDGSRMTMKYYVSVFMKKHPPENAKKYLLVQRSATGREDLKETESYFNHVLKFYDFETPNPKLQSHIDSIVSFSGRYCLRLDSTIEFTPGLECTYGDISNRKWVWIRLSARVYPAQPLEGSSVLLVTHAIRNGQAYKYTARKIADTLFHLKPNQWNYVWHDYMTPEPISAEDGIKSYIWNRNKNPVFVDDIRIEVFEPLSSIIE
ncbi:MAG TPA: hypothetical protein PK028_07910 [Bacteroidales bacterium]|jgi:hypothetical protein|nr:hypothetical protein [Bacteroidales bacterium]MDI9574453.1 hypothetical protein [Bacteroidota bacterium]OQC59015.1 MAG: hypothetical protein BWX51_01756 [Bacteroidetes bacterium ADurb.Bin012]MBP9511368.1 hypothetical protein [Bacteroidales bacterium]MBP9587608.1 hypothetical protein [Bacteroidales bacterium]